MPSKKEQYVRAMARLIKQSDNLEGQALARAAALLEDSHQRIEEALLAGGRDWDQARLRRLRAQVEAVMGDFSQRYSADFRGIQGQGWAVGAQVTEQGLGAFGVDVGSWPALSRSQLEVLQGYSADLITNVGQDAIRRITGIITRGALTELSPFDVMAEITRSFGLLGISDTGPWRATGVLYRAELITRTELLRTMSLGTEVRVQQAADALPALMKRWTAAGDSRTRPTHLAAHGQAVAAKGGKFTVGGYECDYPRDAVLPPEESCNCRCRHIPWMPEWESDWADLDERVQRLMSDHPSARPAELRESAEAPRWPSGVDGLEFVEDLGGTTGARLMRDPATGRLYVLKSGAGADHLREEVWANTIYDRLGVRIPGFKLYETAGGPVQLMEYVENARPLREVLRTADADTIQAIKDKLRQHFGTDALLGNWDVVGLEYDNILIDSRGVPWRIDNGGALRFRARGGAKGGVGNLSG